mgnify:CR=1 FL=1
MSELKLVTVVTPAYNAANYIEETVNTVLNQTYNYLELIIVNDGSKDNTLEILERLKLTDARITVLDKPNSGVCDSRNLGMSKAKGHYITFLDADDLWDLTFLENCITTFNSDKNIHAIYSKAQVINEKSEKQNEYLEANTIKSVVDTLEWKKGFVASMGCTIYTTEIAKKAGLFDPRLSTAADQDFHVRISSLSPIVGIGKVLFYYRVHDNNMHSNISVMEADHTLVFQKAKESGLLNDFWLRKKCFSNLYWILAGSWWKDGNNKLKGFKYILLALLNNPFSLFRPLKR